MKVLIQTIITPLVSASLYLLIFGVSLGAQMNVNENKYLAFLIPGLMMMGLMNNSFQNSSSSIVSGKFTGDLEDLAVAPLSREHIIWAMSFASLIRGCLVAFITLGAGEVFFYIQYGEFLAIQHPLWMIYFLFLGGLVFGQLGLIVAFWAKTFDQLSAIGAFVILPLTYLGGVFMSIEKLHPFWQAVSKLNPLFYFINGLRFGVLGTADISVQTSAGLVAVTFAIFYFFAHRVLTRVSFSRW